MTQFETVNTTLQQDILNLVAPLMDDKGTYTSVYPLCQAFDQHPWDDDAIEAAFNEVQKHTTPYINTCSGGYWVAAVVWDEITDDVDVVLFEDWHGEYFETVKGKDVLEDEDYQQIYSILKGRVAA